ncbi:RagB/SusD family nutrient uptake outer membrane protein [Chitinophaga japonensis]|uniref:Putative outer membrane starch-binding protein n=1 Tax=Chitinophaga japonensis TaxID=104662 RepID=A0A562TES0_CHIJA|nr:RagB/SusD family nutrient uptake outer membrane protein [Chitinophaga japonensis]TWI92037.1 putative outer membrane starch-binding protein [Chitinophaga japonensis]
MQHKHIFRSIRITLWGIAGVLACCLAGCSKDFLDRGALDAVTNESFWETEAQLEQAVNGCYAYLKGKNVVDMEKLADNAIYPPMSDYLAISTGNYDFTLGTLNSEWANQYAGIRRCNHFLENYRKAQGIRDEKMNQFAGEVRFLRAFLYSYLSFFFGDVPLVTNTLNIGDEQVYGPRTPRAQVADFILQQLDSAAAELPVSYDAADLGRITKGAALGWKSRVALFYGKYDVAEAAAKAVMDLNEYHLYTAGGANSYNELFSHKGRLSAGANKETILARLYLIDVATHNMSRECQVPDQTSRFCPTQSLVNTYLCTDGMPIEKSPLYNEGAQQEYADVFENRDPRMAQTILAPGAEWGGKDDGDQDAAPSAIFNLPKFNSDKKGCVTATGYYFTKYVEVSAVGTYNKDQNDIHIMRYAEVLLNYAEAREMQGKLTQADLDMTINLLRDRVGMHHMILSELAAWGLNVREEIRRERRVELALEGQRYFDILRWKQGSLLAEDVKGMKKAFVPGYMQPYVESVPVDADGYMIVNSNRRFVDPKNYLWPIPLTQVQRNPALGQNPGWE